MATNREGRWDGTLRIDLSGKPFRRNLVLLGSLVLLSALVLGLTRNRQEEKLTLVEADDSRIQYTGRIDFSNPKLPRFWAPGVYISARFQGSACEVVVNDQVLWGKSHNYLEVVIDDKQPFRVQTTGPTNTIRITEGLSKGPHTITICKDTEAGIGYLEFVGFRCAGGLLPQPAKPARKLEFIGDSITCGTGSDLSKVACDKGEWYDQHNAYGSYGPATARNLGAQWHLTSVSGIGLMHSCCQMKETIPDVWGNLDLKAGSVPWDFRKYQPDAVLICLGQNDGKQDVEAFTDHYVQFITTIRASYPQAQIVCLTSPMGDDSLTTYQKATLARVVKKCNALGDRKVHSYAFSRRYHQGCGGHPDLADHKEIARELTGYLQTTLNWTSTELKK